MKAGTFNIHDYLNKLYENVNEENLTLNEEEAGSLPDSEGLILPPENKKAYDWLKREYQKGKTEVKVEMSYHEFKPGYHLETDLKSVKDFKPGMYGEVKTGDTEGGKAPKSTAFPTTNFPGSETKGDSEGKTFNKNESSEGEDENDDKKQNGIKVEAKTKEDSKEEEKEKKKKKKEKVEKVNEIFGRSKKEKNIKTQQKKINQAKDEIEKYKPSSLFAEPAKNSSAKDTSQLKRVRINMAKQYMPTLLELKPDLFDLNQGIIGAYTKINDERVQGIVPKEWAVYLINNNYIDNEQAKEKLFKELEDVK